MTKSFPLSHIFGEKFFNENFIKSEKEKKAVGRYSKVPSVLGGSILYIFKLNRRLHNLISAATLLVKFSVPFSQVCSNGLRRYVQVSFQNYFTTISITLLNSSLLWDN